MNKKPTRFEKSVLRITKKNFGVPCTISRLKPYSPRDVSSFFSYVVITPNNNLFLMQLHDTQTVNSKVYDGVRKKYPNLNFLVFYHTSLKYFILKAENDVYNKYIIRKGGNDGFGEMDLEQIEY